MNSEGRWAITVQRIADDTNEPKHIIPEMVRQFAAAYDLTTRCRQCSAPREVMSRSDATTSWRRDNYICPACESACRREEELRAQAAEQAEHERLRRIVDDLSTEDWVFDYSMIDYFDAAVAYGMMLCSASALENGLLGNPYELALCPSDSLLSNLLGGLRRSGILIFRNDTPVSAIHTDSQDADNISYYPLRVNWQFAPPINGESYSEVFRQLGSVVDAKDHDPQYQEAVSKLWWMLAMDDSLKYLKEQLESYRLYDLVLSPKLKEALSYGLTRFSIPCLRNLLWRVARNIAAFASRPGITKRHALNSISGNIIRDCDRALAENWTIKPYCRKWDEEEARLMTLLFDRVLGTGIEGFRCTTGAIFQPVAA